MKKVIYSLLLVFAAVFIACEEELPKANFDLYELKSLEATAGDMSVMLAWEDYENARPSEYLVVWDAGNAGSDGGQMTVEAGKKSVVVVMRTRWPVRLPSRALQRMHVIL